MKRLKFAFYIRMSTAPPRQKMLFNPVCAKPHPEFQEPFRGKSKCATEVVQLNFRNLFILRFNIFNSVQSPTFRVMVFMKIKGRQQIGVIEWPLPQQLNVHTAVVYASKSSRPVWKGISITRKTSSSTMYCMSCM